MKKWYLCLLLLLLAAGCGSEITAPPAGPEREEPALPPVEAVVEAPAEYSAAAALEYLSSSAFAGRSTATDGCTAAGEYLAGLLGEWGYQPLFGDSMAVSYTAAVGDPALAQPEIILHTDDGDVTLVCGVDYTYSFSTQAWEAEKLPLSTTENAQTKNGEAVLLIEGGPADARIRISKNEYLDATGNVMKNGLYLEFSVPAYEQALTARAISISLQPTARTMERDNICAVLPGRDRTKAMVLCAHFDGTGTWGDVLYPGAHDNASGTVALLEAAKLLAGTPRDFDLVIVGFSGEEQLYLGSKALAPVLEDYYPLLNVVNLDCLGAYQTSLNLATRDEAFAQELWPYLRRAGYESYTLTDAGGSDQQSFQAPVVGLLEWPEPMLFHTASDRVETVDVAVVEKVASAVAAYVRDNQPQTWEAEEPETEEPREEEPPEVTILDLIAPETLEELETLRQEALPDLAYDEGLAREITLTDGTTTTVLLPGWRMLESVEEAALYHPGLELPEAILASSFTGAFVRMEGATLMTGGDWQDGEVYPIDWSTLPLEQLDAYYQREGGGWRIRFLVNG